MLSAEFIEGGAGNILVVCHNPQAASDCVTVVVPAFGEEMNKSRRLVWEVGQRLAEEGCRTIVPDLYGTGDSEGEFVDSRWSTWVEDLKATFDWAQSGGARRVQVLAVRLGAALLADAIDTSGVMIDRAVAWAPVRKGRDALTQMLRMKSLAMRMAGERSGPLDDMHHELVTGATPVELGGYDIGGELASSIDSATFSEAALSEVASGLTIELGSVAPGRESDIAESGPWQSQRVAGERFWMVVEPGPNPDLVKETVGFLTVR